MRRTLLIIPAALICLTGPSQSADLAVSASVVGLIHARLTTPEAEDVRLASGILTLPPAPSAWIVGSVPRPGGYRVERRGDRVAYRAGGGFLRVSSIVSGGATESRQWDTDPGTRLVPVGEGFDLDTGPDSTIRITLTALP